VGRETPNLLQSWASLGSRAPGPYLPAAISFSSSREIVECLGSDIDNLPNGHDNYLTS
jgi:hypothetical protein